MLKYKRNGIVFLKIKSGTYNLAKLFKIRWDKLD